MNKELFHLWVNVIQFIPLNEWINLLLINKQMHDELFREQSYLWQTQYEHYCRKEQQQLESETPLNYYQALRKLFQLSFFTGNVAVSENIKISNHNRTVEITGPHGWFTIRSSYVITDNAVKCWDFMLETFDNPDNNSQVIVGITSDQFPFNQQKPWVDRIGYSEIVNKGAVLDIGELSVSSGSYGSVIKSFAPPNFVDGDIVTCKVDTSRPSYSLSRACMEFYQNGKLCFKVTNLNLNEFGPYFPAMSMVTGRKVTIRNCMNIPWPGNTTAIDSPRTTTTGRTKSFISSYCTLL
jgi:hypothetical protein